MMPLNLSRLSHKKSQNINQPQREVAAIPAPASGKPSSSVTF